MATRSLALNRPRPVPALGGALLTLAALGLLAACLRLAQSDQAPGTAWPWLLAVLALLGVGVAGLGQVAQGDRLPARVLPALGLLVLAVLAAEALLRAYGVPTGLIPTPSRVVQALWAARQVLLLDAYTTFVLEALLGFVAGAALGVGAALLSVRYRVLERRVGQHAALLSSVPIVALAPVIIKAVGLGWGSKTVIVAITVLFPVVINTVRGLHSASALHLDLMHAYAATPAQTFVQVRWPSALPFVFTALRVGSTLALINAIVAEFFGTEGHGLGFRIQIEVGRFGLDIVWAAIVVASVLGIAFYLLLQWLEARVLHRR